MYNFSVGERKADTYVDFCKLTIDRDVEDKLNMVTGRLRTNSATLSGGLSRMPAPTQVLQTYHSEVKVLYLTNWYRNMARAAEHPSATATPSLSITKLVSLPCKFANANFQDSMKYTSPVSREQNLKSSQSGPYCPVWAKTPCGRAYWWETAGLPYVSFTNISQRVRNNIFQTNIVTRFVLFWIIETLLPSSAKQ